jgi:hypothetical protein
VAAGRGEIVKADHRIAAKSSIAKLLWIGANPVGAKNSCLTVLELRAVADDTAPP